MEDRVRCLAAALKEAEAAHAEHEKALGHKDDNWPEWYAVWMMGHFPDLFKPAKYPIGSLVSG